MQALDHPVFALSHDLVDRMATHRPATATMWGLTQHDHDWDDLSPAGVAAWRSFLVDAKQELDALPPTTGRWDRLALDIGHAWVNQELALVDSGKPFRDLGHVASPFEGIHLTLTHMNGTTEDGVAAIRARLHGIPTILQGYQASLAHGLVIGERASARQVRSCIEQGHSLVANRLLYILDGPDGEHASDVATQGYRAFTSWLETDYLPAADPTDGVGEARYLPAAKGFLHDDVDLDATYAWGWDLVHALHTDLQSVLERVAPGLTLEEAVESWRTDPAATAASPEAFLDRVRAWQADALQRFEGVVPVPPIARDLTIARAPLGLPPGAWYMQPTEDGSRPGKVQYSLREGAVPLFDQQSTACHEGFPGHHLQLAIQCTLSGRLSRIHRLAFQCIGFAEGWALYAERLVDEHDGYESDLQRAGYLVNQLARACRVVLDIGLHTGRPIPHDGLFAADPSTGITPGATWTYERAVDFMTGIGGLRREVSKSEITRYLGWPGQAISYSVGMKRMLEVREQFLAAGGTLPEFHERVLGTGMVGLGTMADLVLHQR